MLQIGMGIYLGILSFFDSRDRCVSRWMLWGGGISVAVIKCIAVLKEVKEKGGLQETGMGLFLCLLPGIVLWAAGRLTGKIGEADGIVLMVTGVVLPYVQCLETVVLSLFLIGMAALALLVFRFAKRGTRLPYIPFLAAAFWIRYFMGMLSNLAL